MLKQCKSCLKGFETKIKINGKTKYGDKRLNCYICEPYYTHKNKCNDVKIKTCFGCLKEFKNSPEFFNKRPYTKCSNSYCKNCEKETYRKRRDKIKNEALILYGDDKCKLCGYNKYKFNLVFHHINPKEKRCTNKRY